MTRRVSSNTASRGAMRFPGPLLMLFPLVAFGIAVAWLQALPRAGGTYPPPPRQHSDQGLPTWVAVASSEGACQPEVKLRPLHRDARHQQFETDAMAWRFGLGPGQPWRVELTSSPDCERTISLAQLSFKGSNGSLEPLRLQQSVQPNQVLDPVRVMFNAPHELQPGQSLGLVVWGPAPGDGFRMLGLGGTRAMELQELTDSVGSLLAFGPSHGTRTAPVESPWVEQKATLELEILRLTGELENALEDRVAREKEYVAWAEMLAGLVPVGAPPEIHAALGTVPPEVTGEIEEPVNPIAQLKLERSREVFLALRALMVVERLDSLDLLDTGQTELGFTGPVVFRQLDERGRPVGSINADRLRLEGSRMARTLTMVLEDGYERRDGQTFPFAGTGPGAERGGTRRIFLQNTDPEPWFQSLPELFGESRLDELHDDGRWRLFLVHRRLNELLSLDASLGYYRLVSLGGVMGNQFRGVELEQLDQDGGLIKRLFADRMTIEEEPRGMQLYLQDGIQVQGGRKFAFLEGRYRIFLPRANKEDWSACGLPGLVDVKDSPLGVAAGR